MNKAYGLPTSLTVGGVGYSIRTDYRAILDILIAQTDPELDASCKTLVMLQILYEDWKSIPGEYLQEAIDKAVEFIDCGQADDGKKNPRLMDWEQDASMIIPAVNKAAHTEIRAVPYMHWWTFFSYFMETGECLFSSVVHIRQKRAKHKKLEKWEEEYYRENKAIIDLKTKLSEDEQREKEEIEKWL